MSLSRLPLGYCTNVHPGRTLAEVVDGLDRFTAPVQARLGRQIAAGLWLARPVVDEVLAEPDGVPTLAKVLADRGLVCYTLNAFPYGDFHAARVKQNVYLPDWSSPDRLTYTAACAAVLAGLLPDGVDGSISTLPLGYKPFAHSEEFLDSTAAALTDCARLLAQVRDQTGRTVRLAVEPEPCCLLETTAETVAFFERLWRAAGPAADVVREHVGVCYDVCHQAVEFEDAAAAVRALDAAGVRINKVQISCAIEVDRPAANPEAVRALRQYVEPRYLHQTFARLPDGRVVRAEDLTADLLDAPALEFLAAERWRAHFHVPVDADRLGPLGTTRPEVGRALAALARLSYAPHLEVETYTWEVLPVAGPRDLVEGLARELEATEALISTARTAESS